MLAAPSPPPPPSSTASLPHSPGPVALLLIAREAQKDSISAGRLSTAAPVKSEGEERASVGRLMMLRVPFSKEKADPIWAV